MNYNIDMYIFVAKTAGIVAFSCAIPYLINKYAVFFKNPKDKTHDLDGL